MHDELTANDIKKMEDEIEYRKLVVRKKALDDVKVARAQGDLSENFEYKAAKQFKNQNESRIRYLEKMIKTAVVISDESKDDEVGMFNTVDVYFEDDDETETYKIVTTVRGNSLKNLISKESPLGAAIFGHKVGDRCEVKVNDDYSYFVKIMNYSSVDSFKIPTEPQATFPSGLCPACIFKIILYSSLTSGIPATDVSSEMIPASADADITYFQSTCPIAAAVPIPAIAACAIVFTALIPAAFHHFFVFTFCLSTLFFNIFDMFFSLLFRHCQKCVV